MKVSIEQLQKEIEGKYPYCDGFILTWLHDRIVNYLDNETQTI